MRFIYLLDKNKCKEVIQNLSVNNLSNTIKLLWNSDNEFDILMAFAYDNKFLLDLIKDSEKAIDKISLDLVYWCPKGAIYLKNKGKSLNVKEVRNDYVMTNAIINMLHINKSFALTILIEAKENIIKFIKSDFAYGDTNGEGEKYKFHQSLKKVENDILKLELTDEERDTLLNYDNYNLTHPEQKESK